MNMELLRQMVRALESINYEIGFCETDVEGVMMRSQAKRCEEREQIREELLKYIMANAK